MSQDKKKRVCLSVDVKRKILKEVDAKILSKTEISKRYGIPKNSLSTIIKKRDKITTVHDSGVAPSRKYFREAKFPELEKALAAWLRKMRGQNVPIDGNLLKEQAETFALRLNLQGFKGSDGWLQKFKLRHGLTFRKVCGESAAVDMATVNEWKEGRLKTLLSEYSPDDVFNADETGLYFKVLPDQTLVFKGDVCSGGKKAKQRITVMMGANMTGSEKLPLLIIGKSRNPRCFKNIRTLPSEYHANKKAWMTGAIYEKWVRDLDRHFLRKKRKILLVLDNCTAHVAIQGLQAIRVEFLPPNVTSVLQPMDQGIIQCFKRKYRKMLLTRVVLNMEQDKAYDIDLLGAMHLSVRVWNEVEKETIANCFRHAGFVGVSGASEDITVCDDAIEDALIDELRHRNVSVPENVTFQDFVSIDDDIRCTEEISDDDIIRQVLMPDAEEASDDEDDTVVAVKPTLKEAIQWVTGLRGFFEADDDLCALANIDAIEASVYKKVAFKQRKITGFFPSTAK